MVAFDYFVIGAIFLLGGAALFVPTMPRLRGIAVLLLFGLILFYTVSFLLVGPRIAMSLFYSTGGHWSPDVIAGVKSAFAFALPVLITILAAALCLALLAVRRK